MTSVKRKIPIEIWVYIFRLYIQQNTRSVTWHGNSGPWLLSHVCRVWRNVALSAPTLWANIYLSHKPESEEGYFQLWRNTTFLTTLESRLETQLLRSKRAPLHIRCVEHSHQEFSFLPLYGLLIDHCDRWKSVEFDSVPSSIYDVFMQQYAVWPSEKQGTPFSALISLELRSNHSTVHRMFKFAAPKLKSIRLSACTLPIDNALEQLALEAELSRCELLNITATTAAPIVLRCRSTLRDLVLQEATTRDVNLDSNVWKLSTDDGTRASFPQLRSLHLDALHPSGCNFRRLFENIAVPVLTALDTLADRETLCSLVRALRESATSQTLKIIKLRGVEPDTIHLFPLLTMSASLEHLNIAFKRHPLPVSSELDAIITLLHSHTIDSTSRVTFNNCPSLKTLIIDSARLNRPSEVNKSSLAGMVELRTQSPLAEDCVPLEVIAFGSVRGWDDEGSAERRLRTLKMNGLDIKIWHFSGYCETILP